MFKSRIFKLLIMYYEVKKLISIIRVCSFVNLGKNNFFFKIGQSRIDIIFCHSMNCFLRNLIWKVNLFDSAIMIKIPLAREK